MIKSIKIISMEIEGFRRFKEKVVIDFRDGLNAIFADNTSGKSTVGFALMWVVNGYNYDGKKKELGIINDNSSIASVSLTFSDELGQQRTLVRRITKTSQSIKLDKKLVTQKALAKEVDPETYASILNPLWYLNMDTNSMRAFLQKHAEEITVEDTMKSIAVAHQDLIKQYVIDNSIDLTVDKIPALIEEIKKDIKDNAQSKFVNDGILESIVVPNEEPKALIVFDEKSLNDRKVNLKELENKIPVLDVEKTKEFQTKKEKLSSLIKERQALVDNLDVLKVSLPVIKESLEVETEKKFTSKTFYELKDESKNIAQLTTVYTDAKETAISIQMAIEALKSMDSDSQKMIKAIEVLTTVHKQQSEKMINVKKTGADARIKEKSLEMKLSKEETSFKERQASVIKRIKTDLEAEMNKQNNDKLSLDLFDKEKTAEIELLTKEISSGSFDKYANSIKEKTEAYKLILIPLRDEIMQIESNKKAIESQNNEIRTELLITKNNIEKKEKISKENGFLKKMITSNTSLQEAFTSFQIKKSELSSKSVSRNFNEVSFIFEKVIKETGEIKPCLEIYYKNKPLSKASTSELIRAGLEIATSINKLSGCSYPTFIDNGESITSYDKTEFVQIIQAIVREKEKLCIKYQDGTKVLIEPQIVPKNESSKNVA